MYAGNPLALKIVAEVITELFGGEIGPFLEQETVIFSTIRDLLAEQLARLSALAQALLTRFAVGPEPRGVYARHGMLDAPVAPFQQAAALKGRRWRSRVD